MTRILAIIAALTLSTSALAQTVKQTGSITPGHVTKWTSNGIIGDGGTAANGGLTSLGVTNNGGPGTCVSSAPITGPYNQICLTATTNGGTKISSYAIGGATNPGITFDINGSTQGFLTATLPVSDSDLACFDGTTGNIKDCGVVPLGAALLSGHIFVGSVSNVATGVAMSGDCTLAASGAISCPRSAIGFYAEKDGTDQTGLTTAAYNVITFPSFFTNIGSLFDTTNNWWTPPAGYVALHGAIYQTAHAASSGSPVFSAKIRRLHTGVTISHASPAVITWTAHGLVVGQPVQFETSSALPTPLVVDTVYYVISAGLTANTFEISASHGGAAINTTSDGSGTQTGLCDVAAGVGTGIVGLAGFAISQVDSQMAYSNGIDHFHLVYYYTSDDAGNDGVVDGNPAHTHFSGHWVGN